MAKRFTDTEKWKKVWFRKLTPLCKCFWEYLRDNCNHAGIWEVDFELAEFCLGSPLNKEEIKIVFKKQYIEISNGKKWFIKDFIDFQYGSLNENNKAHGSVIHILKKEGVYKGLVCPLDRAKDKDKDMDKDKEKDKDIDFIGKLKQNPAYKHINIDNELNKMDAWLSTRKGRQKTRRFIVNWLNKIDRPVETPKIHRGSTAQELMKKYKEEK